MYLKKLPVQNIQSNTNVNQATQSEIKIDIVQLNKFIQPDMVIALGGATISFVTIWAGVLLVLSKMRRVAEDNKFYFSVNSLQKVPCKTCHYFSNNYHLHCAVQPSIVLTEEAMNCSDYCPKCINFSSKTNNN
ncbi:hypothetical protein QUB80_20845 [Chlorogloeopsis sp. ULAP01]|uniref:hypothetical protein n=1 Tax=Chlorogloeopsis sp. ULAP01 TaxID=3056483 RepID=UPI0025AAF3EB|nr:hypothetical protein [Chlorogloeopsis sp. ULAP01]MDM9383145.1 hypothetical protein [Chlorogloeopsis sp. ULAP01]